MTDEQIKEAMRLGELWAAYAWKACSHGADETVKSQAGRAALEAYLRTIGEPESVNAELLEALLNVARMAEALKQPCGTDPESRQAIRNGKYMSISYAARAAIARAESAIETPAKVSPCAGHAVQQEADETTKRSSGLFKCWICLDTGFIPKAGGLPEPLDVKCPNGCKPKKGGA